MVADQRGAHLRHDRAYSERCRRVIVREAQAADASAILDHYAAVYAESNFLTRGPGEFERSNLEQEGLIRAYAEAPLKLALAAFVGAKLVGSLTFAGKPQPRVRHTGDLGMTVRLAFWGLGIGSAMLDCLIDWTRTTAVITKLNLRVRSDNERAIRLYRGKGFVVQGTVTREYLIDGRYFDQDCMGLEI
jgi:RimJ/RimL family protein N-acetyltransferase